MVRMRELSKYSLLGLLACLFLVLVKLITYANGGNSLILRSSSKEVASSGGLIIHVESWAEGMSGWEKTLSALEVVAKKLNATVVEPGIVNGRLVGHKGNLLLFEVLDKSTFDPEVSWTSLEEFEPLSESSSTVIMHMCLSKRSCPHPACPCQVGANSSSSIPGDAYNESSLQLQKALDLVVSKGKLVVLTIHALGKFDFSKMWITPLQEGQNAAADKLALYEGDVRLQAQKFDFHPRLYEKAASALQMFGTQHGQQFHAIHWRAERANMNYTECAMRILSAQEQMVAQSSSPPSTQETTKFLLLSSLSTNVKRTWRGPKNTTELDDARNALRMILEKDTFFKIDQVYESLELRDPVETAAIDLILAEKASQFATCTKRDCTETCLECNYGGSFALLAIGMREKQNKRSFRCWPNDNV